MGLPIVSIVGRPNVGKSSLFNRMIKKRLAVVDSVSGVTRDRNFSICDWKGQDFYLVDTGGMVPGTDDQMEQLIFDQAQFALDEADVILFITDCQTGVTDIDSRIARMLLRTEKPVLLGVNKSDNDRLDLEANEFYSLGIENLNAVSAASGRGIGDLLDEIVAMLPDDIEEDEDDNAIKVAVVGRPNVGKSSLVNRLLGQERHIVSDVPGTTRDSIDSRVTIEGRDYVLIDTAGLRKRARVKESLEYYTTLRTIRAMQRCDVAMVLLDANEGLNVQELKILEEVAEAGKGMVLVVNKWDTFEKDGRTADHYTRQLHEAMPVYAYLPIIFISALTGQRVVKAMSLVDSVYAEYTRRIGTSELNGFLEEIVNRQPPPAVKGKWIKFYYITQPSVSPPTFVIFSNHPKLIQEPYLRYLTNRMRERFGFTGVPLKIRLKPRKEE